MIEHVKDYNGANPKFQKSSNSFKWSSLFFIDQVFGISGGVIAVLACAIGNYLTIIGAISVEYGVDFFEVLSIFGFDFVIDFMSETFEVIDLLFYGIAAGAGYKFAFRSFTEGDLAKFK